ncbi:matrixin family metalloprotease [Sorangium sp. So ce590]
MPSICGRWTAICYDFTVGDDSAARREDLHAVDTHEAGHFLGLDHTMAGPEATMHSRYDRSDPMNFRTLHDDDIAGICQIYPPRALSTSTCNPIPPHGFSPECADDQLVRCSAAPPAAGGPGWSAPLNTLESNWAYMVIASLAWSLKAWFSLLMPTAPRWHEAHQADRERVLRMEFRSFVQRFILVPAQILHTGRTLVYRLLAWRPELPIFFRFLDAL